MATVSRVDHPEYTISHPNLYKALEKINVALKAIGFVSTCYGVYGYLFGISLLWGLSAPVVALSGVGLLVISKIVSYTLNNMKTINPRKKAPIARGDVVSVDEAPPAEPAPIVFDQAKNIEIKRAIDRIFSWANTSDLTAAYVTDSNRRDIDALIRLLQPFEHSGSNVIIGLLNELKRDYSENPAGILTRATRARVNIIRLASAIDREYVVFFNRMHSK
jgi:hypothetical protein